MRLRRNAPEAIDSNGPKAIAGGEPVVEANALAAVAAVVVTLAAKFGLDLDPEAVLAVLAGAVALFGLIGTLKARLSVTPNHRVPEAE
jgi:hypothetical protein